MDKMAIDGVSVVFDDTFTGNKALLVFETGAQDEPVDAQGLTHLVAATAGPRVPTVNTLVSRDMTFFEFSCPPAELPGQVATLCAAIGNAAEGKPGTVKNSTGQLAVPGLADAWSSLLGRRQPGSAPDRWPALDPSVFSKAEVNEHIRVAFGKGNARMALGSSPAPAGLHFPLADAAPSTRDWPLVTGPFWYADGVSTPCMSIIVSKADVDVFMVLRALEERVEAALRETGYRYSCSREFGQVGEDQFQAGLRMFDIGVENENLRTVSNVLWRETQRLAAEGARLTELPAGYEIDLEAANAAFRAAVERTVVLAVPFGAQFTNLPEVTCWAGNVSPSGEELKPPLLRRHSTKERLFLSSDAVTVVDAVGKAHTTWLADLLVASAQDGLWLGDVRHHCAIDVSPFRHHVARLAAAVPARRHRRAK